MAEQHTQGTKVWLSDPQQGWIQGDVLKVDKDLLHVKTEQGDVKQLKPQECPLQNPGGRGGVEVGHFQHLAAKQHALHEQSRNVRLELGIASSSRSMAGSTAAEWTFFFLSSWGAEGLGCFNHYGVSQQRNHYHFGPAAQPHQAILSIS